VEYENPWVWQGAPFTSDMVGNYQGFVYIITNKLTGKRYIGKKFFISTSRVKVKGKVNRKVVKKQSDWQKYWSSSPSLKKDIEETGSENFSREILWLCDNKSQCTYYELREQIDRRVLETEEYYNESIMARCHRSKVLCIKNNA